MHTQFTEESKMATALTPQTDVTSGEAYRKSIKTQLNNNKNVIKSETSDSFVNHFDGHFAYLKTLDFKTNKSPVTFLSTSTKYQWHISIYYLLGFLLSKGGHRIFNVHSDIF